MAGRAAACGYYMSAPRLHMELGIKSGHSKEITRRYIQLFRKPVDSIPGNISEPLLHILQYGDYIPFLFMILVKDFFTCLFHYYIHLAFIDINRFCLRANTSFGRNAVVLSKLIFAIDICCSRPCHQAHNIQQVSCN